MVAIKAPNIEGVVSHIGKHPDWLSCRELDEQTDTTINIRTMNIWIQP